MTLENNTTPSMTLDPASSTLLFVDEESSILESLQRLFRPHRNRILTAESGFAGLEILASNRVDLEISDMRIGGTAGRVCRRPLPTGLPLWPEIWPSG
jgi:response regulator RpfG family c-di-GMP phosphodiesterase